MVLHRTTPSREMAPPIDAGAAAKEGAAEDKGAAEVVAPRELAPP